MNDGGKNSLNFELIDWHCYSFMLLTMIIVTWKKAKNYNPLPFLTQYPCLIYSLEILSTFWPKHSSPHSLQVPYFLLYQFYFGMTVCGQRAYKFSFQDTGGAERVVVLMVFIDFRLSNWSLVNQQVKHEKRAGSQFYRFMRRFGWQNKVKLQWFVFSLLSLLHQLKRLLSVASVMTGHILLRSNMLQSAKPAVDCSPLQSSQVCRICVVLYCCNQTTVLRVCL